MPTIRPVAIVTGSSSGIGAATARLLAEHGWNVVINYARSAAAADAVAESCRAFGADVLVQQANVAEDADCRAMLITMTKSLARALGPALRVNAVCPGFVRGRWLAEGLGEQRYQAMLERFEAITPLQKVCAPEDVARAIAYFIEGAELTTGETLLMDGGVHLGRL